MDYPDLGYDNQLRKVTSLTSKQEPINKKDFISVVSSDINIEKNPYNNTIISRGSFQSNLGGVFELRDKTGGTILLTADPVTGVVTVAGPITANVTVNFGSMNNSAITGTSSLMGTLSVTGIISGGTFNNITVGTSRSVGGTVNTPKIESPTFNVNPASNSLLVNGAFEIQTAGGSALLAGRVNGTTYKWVPGGVIA